MIQKQKQELNILFPHGDLARIRTWNLLKLAEVKQRKGRKIEEENKIYKKRNVKVLSLMKQNSCIKIVFKEL